MRTPLTLVAVVLIAGVAATGAWASDVPAVQEPAAAAAPAAPESAGVQVAPAHAAAQAAPVEAAAAAGTTADQAAPAGATADQATTLKMATVPPPADFKIPSGYRPVKQGLDTVYCTSITPTGSRMPKTYCMTRAQVEDRQRQSEIARRDVVQKASGCAGGGCGAN